MLKILLSIFTALIPFPVYSETGNVVLSSKQNEDDRQEFEEKFIVNDAYFVLAAENNYNPASMMGHSFLRISGDGRENGLSYFTNLDESLFAPVKSLFGYGTGYYIVQPYSKMLNNYVYDEKRSIWEFKLILSQEEKSALKQSIWKLHGKKDFYKFITHNCNNAIENLLGIVNPEFISKRKKPYITPVEYAQYLYSAGKIQEINYRPAYNSKGKITLKNILDAKKTARMAIFGGRLNGKSSAYFEFSPVYQDIRSTGDAYPAELETKLLYLKLRKRQGGGISISDYALIRLKAIRDLSTYFNLGYEEDYLSVAAGIGAGFVRMLPAGEGGFSAYFLPIAGIRHGTGYIEGEFGFISRIGSLFKTGISASAGTDYHSAKAFLSISLGRNVDFLAEYEGRYAGNSDKIGIKGISSDDFNSIKAGASFFF